ncbi:MAG: transcription termination/antitermination NusG family protein [Verrucomicrobiota bacterium]
MTIENAMILPENVESPSTPISWYCLRSQPKHEHIAAATLRKIEGVEVFCPRIRLRKMTPRGAVWFVEALFPNYLFAKFDLTPLKLQVQYSQGVSSILKFGDRLATLPEHVITDLRREMDHEEIRVIPEIPEVGSKVKIAEGAFKGITAVVHEVMPAKERVRLLLDFLGRPAEVQLNFKEVVPYRRKAGHGEDSEE